MDWTLQDDNNVPSTTNALAVAKTDVGVDAPPRAGSQDVATQTGSVDCALLELARAALGRTPINVWVLETVPVTEELPAEEERTYATLRTVQADGWPWDVRPDNGWLSPSDQPMYAAAQRPMPPVRSWDERSGHSGWTRDSIPDASVSDDERSVRGDTNHNMCSLNGSNGNPCPNNSLPGTPGASKAPRVVEVFTCKLCSKRFTDQLNYKYHKRLHKSQKLFTCPKCNQKFAREKTLERHKLTHIIARTRTQTECPLCGKALAGRRDLKKHLALGHDHTGKLRYLQYQCHICAISLATKHSLRRHLFIHSGQKPYCCPQCNKAFAFELYLRNHLKKHSEAGRPFACACCEDRFASKRELRRHVASHRRLFRCHICDKTFKGKTYFQLHVKSHDEEKKEKKKFRFVCDVCGEGFRLKGEIRAHIRTHVTR